MLSPRRTKFRKQQRGRMTGLATRGNEIAFGQFALQAIEPSWITSRQIESCRRAMNRESGMSPFVSASGRLGVPGH